MAISRTLAQLRTAVRDRGDYNNSRVFTDTMLTEFINEAWEEVYAELVLKWEDYFTAEASPVLTTSVGVATVALPSDFFKLIRLDLQVATDDYLKLRRFNVAEEPAYDDAWISTPYGRGYVYRIQGDNLVLRPTPVSVDTLRLLYVPQPTALSADGDTVDPKGVPGVAELVIQLALFRADTREERPTAEREREIARLWERVNRWADARSGDEAFLLPDHGRGVGYW